MMLKILLTITLMFAFFFIVLFALTGWEKTHRNDEKIYDGLMEMCAWSCIFAIIFGVFSLATWIVWG